MYMNITKQFYNYQKKTLIIKRNKLLDKHTINKKQFVKKLNLQKCYSQNL